MTLKLVPIDVNDYDPAIHRLPIAGQTLKGATAVKIVFEDGQWLVYPTSDNSQMRGMTIRGFNQGEEVQIIARGNFLVSDTLMSELSSHYIRVSSEIKLLEFEPNPVFLAKREPAELTIKFEGVLLTPPERSTHVDIWAFVELADE